MLHVESLHETGNNEVMYIYHHTAPVMFSEHPEMICSCHTSCEHPLLAPKMYPAHWASPTEQTHALATHTEVVARFQHHLSLVLTQCTVSADLAPAAVAARHEPPQHQGPCAAT